MSNNLALPQQGGGKASEEKPGVTGTNATKEDILNAIYGNNNLPAKPTTTKGLGEWMNKVMGRHDPATLVVIAVLVAVSCAAVLIAVSWLVLNRITAHRRRINIQNVITDLQSRDKIVLLNSESEEE